jgi:tRNA 2-thiouridine synthesizing protein A
MPVVKTKRSLSEMEQGVLTVIVDDEIVSRSVARAAERAGCTATTTRDGTDFHVRIQKGEAAEPAESRQEAAAQPVVLVSGATLGRGDDVLGGILLKAFLYALTQSPSPPKALVLVNSAVRLAVEGSECLEFLRGLAGSGAEVAVCATSLDHFGLADRLAVGRASSMDEIVEMLASSPRTISL